VTSRYRLIAIKTFDGPAVNAALARLRSKVAHRVSGAVRGWVAAFPDQPDELDSDASRLSAVLSLPVVVAACHEDRFFSASRYDRGALTDAVDSLAPAPDRPRRPGAAEQWRDLMPAGVPLSDLEVAMSAHERSRAETSGAAAALPHLERFLAVLGLPQALDGHALAADPNCLMVEVRRYQRVPAYRPSLIDRLLGRSRPQP